MNSTWTIVPYDSLCFLKTFIINGIEAEEYDFVIKNDTDPENAYEGCGYMEGEAIPATAEILEKYNITLDEYKQISEEAAKAVSFGCCGWCS